MKSTSDTLTSAQRATIGHYQRLGFEVRAIDQDDGQVRMVRDFSNGTIELAYINRDGTVPERGMDAAY